MKNELQGKSIWVTGASGGLGIGISQRLAEAGFNLGLHYLTNGDRLQSLADELKSAGHNILVTGGDLADTQVAKQSAQTFVDTFGAPYALVHLAGPYVRKRVVDHSREEFDLMVNGNLTSFYESVRAIIGSMRDAGCGRIIATAMSGAHITVPMRFTGPHLAAKSAVVALARTLALEEASHGITVNVISPGHIPHKEWDRERARSEKAGPAHPMGVHGSFDDIADAILYLLSPGASYINGAVLEISGGWLADDYKMDTD